MRPADECANVYSTPARRSFTDMRLSPMSLFIQPFRPQTPLPPLWAHLLLDTYHLHHPLGSIRQIPPGRRSLSSLRDLPSPVSAVGHRPIHSPQEQSEQQGRQQRERASDSLGWQYRSSQDDLGRGPWREACRASRQQRSQRLALVDLLGHVPRSEDTAQSAMLLCREKIILAQARLFRPSRPLSPSSIRPPMPRDYLLSQLERPTSQCGAFTAQPGSPATCGCNCLILSG